MNAFKAVTSYWRLTNWEREVLMRGVRTEGMIARAFRHIPWSGVAMFAFVMIFFGIDLGAGIKYTAQRMKDKREEAANSIEVKRYQAKQWSVEKVKEFRDGDLKDKIATKEAESDFVPLVPEGAPRTSYGSHQQQGGRRNGVF